jgi:hypothetical protein
MMPLLQAATAAYAVPVITEEPVGVGDKVHCSIGRRGKTPFGLVVEICSGKSQAPRRVGRGFASKLYATSATLRVSVQFEDEGKPIKIENRYLKVANKSDVVLEIALQTRVSYVRLSNDMGELSGLPDGADRITEKNIDLVAPKTSPLGGACARVVIENARV